MCGIAGFWSFGNLSQNIPQVLNRMSNSIYHRGPDSGDHWIDENSRIGFSHRRLSIIDLTIAGNQPMFSHNQLFVIIFNGEIYNHLELRSILNESNHYVHWNGHSDTETLLACFEAWGIKKTLQKLVGMFAFALWDVREKKLTIARDRFGEKPLYYSLQDSNFVFASELKAIREFPEIKCSISRAAHAFQTEFSYIPDPLSIYEDIFKLSPASFITLDEQSVKTNSLPKAELYWSAYDVAKKSIAQKLSFKSDSEAVNSLETLLKESISGQMVSDVPLGAFLSGGIDSSLVVALMQAQSNVPINTFTIGFHEKEYNEASQAKLVAAYLATNHTELYVNSSDALNVVDSLATIYDEPFSDASQIPTYLVSKLAREKVTVCLSGDGGDELFGGYNRYFQGAHLWDKLSKIPLTARKFAKNSILAIPPDFWSSFLKLVTFNSNSKLTGDKLYKAARAISAISNEELYYSLVSHIKSNQILNLNTTNILHDWPDFTNTIDQLMFFDTVTYLPGDILTKIDRAGMAVSLESRIPILDHRIYDFAWKLPQSYKIRNGEGKWILKQLLYKYVPEKLVNRPKMGFSVPIGEWLRGPLKKWAEDLLQPIFSGNEGYYNKINVKNIWQQHQQRKNNWDYVLWNILMFQLWRQKNNI